MRNVVSTYINPDMDGTALIVFVYRIFKKKRI